MTPTMRTDCLRTRNLIHTGLLILADKLRMLSSFQARITESIMDACCALYMPQKHVE